MFKLTLQPIANQSFSVEFDGSSYDIVIRNIDSTNNKMAIDITRDNIVIIQGFEIVGNTRIIPYPYLEKGNFTLSTNDDELPNYTQFGISQFLYYITVAELAAG